MTVQTNSKLIGFIAELDRKTVAKTGKTLRLLEEFGYELRMPHSQKVTDKFYELRIMGKIQVRIFYCYYKGDIYLLNGFIKKSGKIPHNEFVVAEAMYKNLTFYNL